jgi:hypothetical protein
MGVVRSESAFKEMTIEADEKLPSGCAPHYWFAANRSFRPDSMIPSLRAQGPPVSQLYVYTDGTS